MMSGFGEGDMTLSSFGGGIIDGFWLLEWIGFVWVVCDGQVDKFIEMIDILVNVIMVDILMI